MDDGKRIPAEDVISANTIPSVVSGHRTNWVLAVERESSGQYAKVWQTTYRFDEPQEQLIMIGRDEWKAIGRRMGWLK